jgi:hypothetical protein
MILEFEKFKRIVQESGKGLMLLHLIVESTEQAHAERTKPRAISVYNNLLL